MLRPLESYAADILLLHQPVVLPCHSLRPFPDPESLREDLPQPLNEFAGPAVEERPEAFCQVIPPSRVAKTPSRAIPITALSRLLVSKAAK